jgi:hypothetical protein
MKKHAVQLAELMAIQAESQLPTGQQTNGTDITPNKGYPCA